jgi:hypothetical protein
MAAISNALLVYGDSGAKEDVVLNAIEVLTAREEQIANIIGKSTALAVVHSYLTQALRTAQSRAVEEGAAYTAIACNTPTRVTNIVEHIAIPFTVSRTQQAIAHFTGGNELERQSQLALMDFGNALEFDLVRSTLTSGADGTAPKCEGVIVAISRANNTTVHNSGTVWAASILDGLMKDNWDNSNGDVATDLFMGSFLRNATDAFTAKSNIVVAGAQQTLVRTVSVYENAFGTLALHTHRYVQVSGTDATGRVLGINPQKLAVAWLERPYVDTGLARTGNADVRAVAGSFTVEVQNRQSNFFASGFDID